jgi:hypothetical protein
MDNSHLKRELRKAAIRYYGILFGLSAAACLVILLFHPTFEEWYGYAFLIMLGICMVAYAITDDRKPDRDKHIYVKHVASGEWGWYPPRKHPFIPFRDLGFTVIPFDYAWHEEKQAIKGGTVTFSWRPDLKDLRQWIESDKDEHIKRLREHSESEESLRFYRGRGFEIKGYRFIPALVTPTPQPEPQEVWETYPDDELHIANHEKQPVFLTDDDRIAHVQIIGASRLGKSKLVEYVIRQFIARCEGVCVIDPNQQLYDDILTWCVHRGLGDETIHFLDPSDARSTIGFNPFRLEGKRTPDRIAARANRLLSTTLKSLGMPGDTAIQAQRIIRCLYYVIIEQNLPITELKSFMTPRLFDRRDEIMARCQSEDICDQWAMLTEGKGASAYVAMMQSSANRLFDLIAEPGVQRIMTNPHPINVREITEKSDMLIVNLGKSDIFSTSARNVIGSFLVDEIWDVMSSRTKQQVENILDYNFVVDEFHNFATPEFAEMLKEGAKYKLHLWLINHNLDDLERSVRSALNACHIRIAFGGTAPKDAAFVMEGSRPSSRYSELKNEIAAIPSLKKRVFALRRTGKKNVFCSTPWVESFPVTEQAKQAYLDEWTRVLKIEAAPILKAQEPVKAPAPKPLPISKLPTIVESDDFYH